MINALTIDVEEYFHPTEVQLATGSRGWNEYPSRIEPQIDGILRLLDRHAVRATFFVLGWVAERHPAMVRRIAAEGHEIGCHSYAHQMVNRMTPEEFREDTRRAVARIFEAYGERPRAYRAPSYSITQASLWALEILVECGFQYDSSIYPIQHDRYGIPGFGRHAQWMETPAGPLLEIPIATARLGSRTVAPVGGGGYLRLLPARYTIAGIRAINQNDRAPACIYFHPWELDPGQPHLARGLVSRLRTYTGLAGMERKLDRLLGEFQFSTLSSVYPLKKPAVRTAGTGSSNAA
jgi:polysaccharide deacetylase family protein (PEP-CTERM system associated)